MKNNSVYIDWTAAHTKKSGALVKRAARSKLFQLEVKWAIDKTHLNCWALLMIRQKYLNSSHNVLLKSEHLLIHGLDKLISWFHEITSVSFAHFLPCDVTIPKLCAIETPRMSHYPKNHVNDVCARHPKSFDWQFHEHDESKYWTYWKDISNYWR